MAPVQRLHPVPCTDEDIANAPQKGVHIQPPPFSAGSPESCSEEGCVPFPLAVPTLTRWAFPFKNALGLMLQLLLRSLGFNLWSLWDTVSRGFLFPPFLETGWYQALQQTKQNLLCSGRRQPLRFSHSPSRSDLSWGRCICCRCLGSCPFPVTVF